MTDYLHPPLSGETFARRFNLRTLDLYERVRGQRFMSGVTRRSEPTPGSTVFTAGDLHVDTDIRWTSSVPNDTGNWWDR